MSVSSALPPVRASCLQGRGPSPPRSTWNSSTRCSARCRVAACSRHSTTRASYLLRTRPTSSCWPPRSRRRRQPPTKKRLVRSALRDPHAAARAGRQRRAAAPRTAANVPMQPSQPRAAGASETTADRLRARHPRLSARQAREEARSRTAPDVATRGCQHDCSWNSTAAHVARGGLWALGATGTPPRAAAPWSPAALARVGPPKIQV